MQDLNSGFVGILVSDNQCDGRTKAEVILPKDRSPNRAMVEQGLAWCYREFAPQDHELARLEAEARSILEHLDNFRHSLESNGGIGRASDPKPRRD